MGYINPISSKRTIIKHEPTLTSEPLSLPQKKRAKRSDSTHDIKFPVTSVVQMKLKSYYRLTKDLYERKEKETLSQTKFNTRLLEYGLKHKEILQWNHPYKDTKIYMHTKPLEILYLSEIGGAHGLTVQKNLSDRRVVYQIILSVIKWLERGGSLEKII